MRETDIGEPFESICWNIVLFGSFLKVRDQRWPYRLEVSSAGLLCCHCELCSSSRYDHTDIFNFFFVDFISKLQYSRSTIGNHAKHRNDMTPPEEMDIHLRMVQILFIAWNVERNRTCINDISAAATIRKFDAVS